MKMETDKLKVDLTGFMERINREGAEARAEHDAAAELYSDKVFVLGAWEQQKQAEWWAIHKEVCTLRFDADTGERVAFPGGAAGGALTYEFTPTGIGMAYCVTCGCGEEINLTDYRIW